MLVDVVLIQLYINDISQLMQYVILYILLYSVLIHVIFPQHSLRRTYNFMLTNVNVKRETNKTDVSC